MTVSEYVCDCGAMLDENGECPYCDSPGLPFARDDPKWDEIYGTRRLPPYPPSQKDMMDASHVMEAYARTHEVVMELNGTSDPQTQAEVWAVQAWTSEEYDGEPMRLLSYTETKSATPMGTVQKAIALLDAPIPDFPTMKNSEVNCRTDCRTALTVLPSPHPGAS